MFTLTWRNLLARKVRLLMSALAIVLGIAFLVGVLVFSTGLNNTFNGIIEGSTSDAVVRPAGTDAMTAQASQSELTLTPDVVDELNKLPEVEVAEGSVDGMGMYLLTSSGKLISTQGAPTLAFNHPGDNVNMLGEPMMTVEEGRWPAGPGEIVLDPSSAERGGYEVGDTVAVIPPSFDPSGAAQQEFELVGIAGFTSGGIAGASLLVFETGQAQDLFLGGQDVFTSIYLTAAEGVSQDELVAAAEAAVPERFEAVTGDQVVEETQKVVGQILGFITTFLVTFAAIAILVGAFIIANTFMILVAQRVRELALLRALGASRRQITRSVLLEALIMALVGTTLGIGLGVALAYGLAALFRAFGLEIDSDALGLTPTTVLAAYAVGLVVTLVSAYVPARRAGKVSPVAAMGGDHAGLTEKSLHRRSVVGAFFLALGAVLAVLGLVGAPGNDALYIGGAAVVWVLTVAAISPVIGYPVLVACRALFGKVFGTPGRLAGDNALRNPRRTGATASALMIGLALVSAVGVLAASMSKTTDALVDEQFAADFLVQSANFGNLPTAVGDQMAEVDGVAVVAREQWMMVKIDGEDTFITGTDAGFSEVYEMNVLEGTNEISGDQAMLNETTADKYGVAVGDTLTLAFLGGRTGDLEVAGIIEDTQVVSPFVVPMSVLADAGLKRTDNVININLEDGADADAVLAELEDSVADLPFVTVSDKEKFAENLKGQVNQLLFMIYGLLALAVVIAVFGIVNTLGLSVIERTREIGLLRAVGLTRARLRRMVTLESVTISVMGAVLGMALGLLIGVLLRQSLSEDLTELGLPLGSLAAFLVIAVLFGVVAAVFPAIRASRMKVLDAIAHE